METEKALRPSILIVDDRKEKLLATERVLKSLPAALFKASSGAEALSLMRQHRFAVALLDVQMDGFEIAALMQGDEAMRATPIIFVADAGQEDVDAPRAAEIGAADYVFKPINPDILRSKVKVYMDLYTQREQILQLNATLRQSNEELERFAYICSHDLKSPLRAIDNISQWIIEDLGEALQGKSLEHMGDLRKRVRRMENLLDDTLEYARIGSKTDEGGGEMVDGRTLAENVVELAAPPPGFTVRIADSLSSIRVNRLPLQQVLYNLVNNAIKHHHLDDGVIEIHGEEAEAHHVFSVSDDGPGIEHQHHAKIFEMFQTLKPRDQKEGSGMGLAIVKKILATCGGDIALESAPGQGAVFRFTWPKKEKKHE